MSVLKYFRPKSKARLLRGDTLAWIENNSRGTYIKQCVLSYPPWVDRAELQALWDQCRTLEGLTGLRFVLDHIVPLRHPLVCGLSVPWNMRPVPYACNATKSNKFNPHQGELFDNHEHNPWLELLD